MSQADPSVDQSTGSASQPVDQSSQSPDRLNRPTGGPARPLVVFCDFDGTITEKDMIITVVEKFCPPVWRQIVDDIVSKKITVKDGVVQLFEMIPSAKKTDVMAYAKDVLQLRAGFESFLHFCDDNGLRFVVCSGGVDFLIEPAMAPFAGLISKIYSIPTDSSGPTISLRHTLACETEGTCKVKVMDQYPGSLRILIGDSITDLHGARFADIVFARAGLKKYLDEEKIHYYPFETFHDVIETLEQFKGPNHAHQEEPAANHR